MILHKINVTGSVLAKQRHCHFDRRGNLLSLE